MKIKILLIAIIISLTTALNAQVRLQTTDSLASSWSELSMQGKLSFEGLPIKPTVKVYMKRAESIIISARAPIVGEVARIEVCKDSITFINKHTKRYFSQDIRQYTTENPDIMSDFQDLFLGEIAIPGHGPLTPELSARCQWNQTNDRIFVYPEESLQWQGVQYGYMVEPDELRLQQFILFVEAKELIVAFDYLYGPEGWTLGLAADLKGHPLEGSLQLSYPDYFPTPLEFTNAGARYSRSDLKGILKF